MNEAVVKGNYVNQALIEMTNGYRQAYSAYGQLRARSEADKRSAWVGLFKGIETYVDLTLKDMNQAEQTKNLRVRQEYADERKRIYNEEYFGPVATRAYYKSIDEPYPPSLSISEPGTVIADNDYEIKIGE